MVGVIDRGEEPPQELQMVWDCRRWGALPENGGILDQSARLLHRMNVVDNVFNAVNKLRNAMGEDIHKLTISERKIIAALRKERMI